jgi:uncharacterized protein (DUF1330 family)
MRPDGLKAAPISEMLWRTINRFRGSSRIHAFEWSGANSVSPASGKHWRPTKHQYATIKAAGGRFIAIGGVAGLGAKPVTGLQGTPPKRVTIQAWDSLDALKTWFNGADYQAALKIGEKYATFRRFAVEGQ